MKAFVAAIFFIGAISTGLVGMAQPSAPATARAPGYDQLGSIVGRSNHSHIGPVLRDLF